MNDAPNTFPLKPSENLAPGNELKWPIWRVLNRLRTGVGRSKSNLLKCRYVEDDPCECEATQTLPHLFECPNSHANILNLDELFIPSDGAVELARLWSQVCFLGCRARGRRIQYIITSIPICFQAYFFGNESNNMNKHTPSTTYKI